MAAKSYEIDMTNGPIFSKIIAFSIPLALSGMLQLFFNAADIIVVGQYSGTDAQAAVGATTGLINAFTNLFMGTSLGANVLSARAYATGDREKMEKTVHTAILMALIGGIFMSLIGIFAAKLALQLMKTPKGIIAESTAYMRIYFIGLPFTMLYNFGAAILRGIGDTKRPLWFLSAAGVMNILLNLLFVIGFDGGARGVALATVISQMVSCILVLRCLARSNDSYRLSLKKLRINRSFLWQILKIGLPAGIQSAVINMSNALLQSSINGFGEAAVAGYTAANNIFGFLYVNVNAVSQACMSFVSQNFGVQKADRMDKVARDCAFIQIIFTLTLGFVFYAFGTTILQIYNDDTDVIRYGMEVLSYTVLPYFLCGLMDMLPGAMRGMNCSLVPMFLSMIGTVGSRIVWIYAFFPMHKTVSFLFICYPLSWAFTLLMQSVCLYFVRKSVRQKMISLAVL